MRAAVRSGDQVAALFAGPPLSEEDGLEQGAEVQELHREDLDNFRSFLRSLIMHAAVGTALGGVCTTVGEPQNLIIADKAGWDFVEFFIRMAPVTIPVFVFGLLTTVILEKTGMFSYGAKFPAAVRQILVDYNV